MAVRSVSVLAASVLLLAGCSAPAPIPPGLTDAEAEAVALQRETDYWLATSYRGSLAFPAIAPVGLTTPDSWASSQVTCLRAGGLPAREPSGGFAVDGNGSLSPADSVVVQVTCLAQYPVDPREQGYLSDAQALYAYDYFTARLAPCLALLGYRVSPPPDRDHYPELLHEGIMWTPYVDERFRPLLATPAQWTVINGRCPPLPVHPFSALQPPAPG